jgi:hypothetical protein
LTGWNDPVTAGTAADWLAVTGKHFPARIQMAG